MGTRCRALSLTVPAAALLLSGCTAKPAPPSHSARPTTIPSIDAASGAPAEQATAVYLNLLHAYVAASNSGSTDTRELARYASGSALATLAHGLDTNKAQRVRTKGQPLISQPRVSNASAATDPSQLDLVGCVDDTHWLVYRYDGRLLNNTPGGPRPTTARVTKTAGGWRVTLLAIQKVGTCTG